MKFSISKKKIFNLNWDKNVKKIANILITACFEISFIDANLKSTICEIFIRLK